MKECVYGWYPPANDPWKSYRDPGQDNSYDQECLYSHWNSKYNGQTGVSTPQFPTPPRMYSSRRHTRQLGTTPVHQSQVSPDFNPLLLSTAPPSRTASRPASRTASRTASSRLGFAAPCSLSVAERSSSQASLRIDGQTPAGAPIQVFSPTFPSRPTSHKSNRSVTNKKPWATRVAETQTSLLPQPPSLVREPSPSLRLHSGSLKPSRIQSATAHRPRVTPPARAVQSADPSKRSPPDAARNLDETKETVEDFKEVKDEDKENVEKADEEDDDDDELGVDDPLDYDEQLQRYGWRMEVPGDPLNLKRQCFPKRKKYTVSVPIPEVAPYPPKAHLESSETFFYNTIPRKPLTVTIHGDWASEVLCAKRLDLQKRDGDKYKYRTHFHSFVY